MSCRTTRAVRREMLLAIALLLAPRSALAETTLVQFGTAMRHLANADDPGIGTSWTAEAFDDAGWQSGSYGVGYDTAASAQQLLLTVVPAGTVSVYTRARFTLASPSDVHDIWLGADWDDGYVAWVNGVEVYRSPEMPGDVPAWNTLASQHESSNGATASYLPLHDISALALPVLHAGENVLAIGAWNSSASSSDLVLVPKLLINADPLVSRGPYLQRGSSTGVTVRWRTNVASDSEVRYGTSPTLLTSVAGSSTPSTEHVVSLTGLAPDTRYYYSVGTTAGPLVGGDADHSVLTSPTAGTSKPLRIWVLGDSGFANADARAVRDAYTAFTATRHTDLWMMLGDNAYPNGTDTEYQAAVFDTYPQMLAKSVLWPTYGNHDGYSADASTQSGPYYDIFTLPAGAEAGGIASGTEAYYSFDYADIHFVCLDSYQSARTAGSPMLSWLQDDLAATSQRWIVAFFHHPPYTKGSHDSDVDTESLEMRGFVLPILEDFGVDLVLCGHSHSYERSYLLDGHYGPSSTFNASHQVDSGSGRPGETGAYTKPLSSASPHDGAVYAVAGSSAQASGGNLNHPAMFVSMNRLGSMVLDFSGNRLDAKFLDSVGSVADSFSLIKDPARLPVVEFGSAPLSGTVPLSVTFTDRTVNGPLAWAWDFDNDGTTDDLAQNAAHIYTQPGIYTVRLAATNVAGTAATSKSKLICVTGSSAPNAVQGLQLASDESTLTWQRHQEGATYDVVRGDTAVLLAAGGDFAAALQACVENDSNDEQAWDAAVPATGSSFFYLVRAVRCDGLAGTWDESPLGQVGSRDAAMNAAQSGCP
ncbi:MAG: metallophosphoesterase [Acidobacteriota bacterium]